MKKNEIVVGGLYVAKVGTNITTVRVDAIREIEGRTSGSSYWAKTTPATTVYDVTNVKTGRKVTFRSAMKFREVSREGTISNKLIHERREREADIDRELACKVVAKTLIVHDPDTAEGKKQQEDAIVFAKTIYDPPAGYNVDGSKGLLASDAIARGEKFEGGSVMTAAQVIRADECSLNEDDNKVQVVLVGNPRQAVYGFETKTDSVDSGAAQQPSISNRPSGFGARLTKSAPAHLLVEARAGTGKTFTIVVGIAWAFRDRVPQLWSKLIEKLGFDPQPSEQQQKVWDAMKLSSDAATVQMTAFNKSIVREFETKWGWLIAELRNVGISLQFATNHSMGFAAVRKSFGSSVRVDEHRVVNLLAKTLEMDVRQLMRDKFELVKVIEKLVSLVKMNMCGTDAEQLDELVAHYDIELDKYRTEAYELIPQILEACKQVRQDGCIDYDDMIWLPCVLDLQISRNDLLLVDECQDLNRCQQELALKAGRRLILVGDPKQAIYGFAGADAQSINRMLDRLTHTTQGCQVLPLTVTRRCGHAIVKEANAIVKDFAAHETNPAGVISSANYPVVEQHGRQVELPFEKTYLASAKSGDMVLCRVNGPLVSNCFRFLKRGIKANIQGRDIGAGLVSTIKKLRAKDVPDLVGKIGDWLAKELAKEQAKRIPSEARQITLTDRADCLMAFTEAATTVTDVIDKIQTIFTDDRQGGGVRLSSIHRAKGLEAKRVFLLEPKGATVPHPMAKSAWQREQEMNLRYVAITRAIEHLTYVS